MKPSLTCSILINKLYKPKTHLLFLTLPHTNSTCIFIYVCPYHYDLYNRLFHAYPIKPSLFLPLKTHFFKNQNFNSQTTQQRIKFTFTTTPFYRLLIRGYLPKSNGSINGCLRIVFIRQLHKKYRELRPHWSSGKWERDLKTYSMATPFLYHLTPSQIK